MKRRKLDIRCFETQKGIRVRAGGKTYTLEYPSNIWKKYPSGSKEILTDNLAYLLTLNIPLVSKFDTIEYNRSMPVFKPFFDAMVMKNIPSAVNDYKDRSFDVIKKFLSTDYIFRNKQIKFPDTKSSVRERAIVPMSCGKDSLLTLGVLREIGLDPVCVYINDTVSPKENRIKLKQIKEVAAEYKLKVHVVTNNIERLNDFETWNTHETCAGYMHMMTGFCLISLPFANYYGARYIVMGNQQDMDFPFVNKEGVRTYPSPDQCSEWTAHQSSMVNMMNPGTNVISVIEPLTNIAITRVLHSRYSDLGCREISCDCLDASDEPRWCHDCNKCARISLFMHAVGIDPAQAGFHKKLLNKKHSKLYALFNGSDVDHYERSPEARDQQLLAFYMAYKRGIKGELIDMFRKKHLGEAKKREKELHQKFFTIYETELPRKIKKKVCRIYTDELRNVE
ncbi:MAG: hypothetical protein ABH868_07230 [bacterium]